ncbi:MAG: ribosome biogenesis GTPase Der, partial [Alphaproteobacteria bacterium]|nr:ribosome biogenesis GTPase Der [Alphaproteobacteria bacterium]
ALTVAIIGRPNVGKSTLFNRLVGRRTALVHETPGLTRDWKEGKAKIGDLSFTVIDTAGYEDESGTHLDSRMWQQSQKALLKSDVALFLIDAREGLTEIDRYLAQKLHKSGIPVILIANKCEGNHPKANIQEAFALGFETPLPISAEHGEGLVILYDALKPLADKAVPEAENEEQGSPLQLAIVGRPNSGKSTLINNLVGEERLLTGPEAGITRDAIGVNWSYKNKPIHLIDTAGLRRRAKIKEKVERISVISTKKAIQYAECVILLLDATSPFEKQDLTIARQVVEEGRCLLIALNKWDLITPSQRKAYLKDLVQQLELALPQVRGIPCLPISALAKEGFNKLFDSVFKLYEIWNKRLPTSPLNRWLEDALFDHTPPLIRGRRLKVRYMTQVKSRPPTFVLFANFSKEFPESYKRYLLNGLRKTFSLDGVPLRLNIKTGKNPYVKED